MAKIKREKLRIYALVPDISTEGGTKKYYVVGKGSTSGTLSFGYATEEQKDITSAQSGYVVNKGAWTIQLTGKAETSDNVQNYITMNSIRGDTEALMMDILVVFEHIHKQDDPEIALAMKGKAVIPLTSLGGDGQTDIQYDATLSTSGDLTIGSISLNEAALAGAYDPVTDIYETTAFTAGDIKTNLDPKPASEMSLEE